MLLLDKSAKLLEEAESILLLTFIGSRAANQQRGQKWFNKHNNMPLFDPICFILSTLECSIKTEGHLFRLYILSGCQVPLGNNERCNLVVWIFFISRSMVRFSHQIICIQSDFLDACSRFLSEIADRELVWERGFLIFLTWNFRWMSLSYLYIFFLVNGETLIWTSRGAGKLGYVEKWQRQRTNISQWLWQHGEKTQVDVKSGAKLMETFSFFSAADLPQECRTRRSYSLDRIHLYDSYFPFPFQNKYLLLSLSNDFLRRISLRKLFWTEVFVAINLLANDPECNLSRQWHPN